MGQTVAKALPAHVGIGGGQERLAAPNRVDYELEAERDRMLEELKQVLAKHLTPSRCEALRRREYLERFETEIEVLFQRIDLLSAR